MSVDIFSRPSLSAVAGGGAQRFWHRRQISAKIDGAAGRYDR